MKLKIIAIVALGVMVFGFYNWIYPWSSIGTNGSSRTDSRPMERNTQVKTTTAGNNGTTRVKETVYKDKDEPYQLTMIATAYSLKSNTRTGTRPKMGTISVDPKVIPLGTRLYVEGYGHGTALDTGGAIKGRRLDLWFPSSRAARRWGEKKVNVHVYR